VFLGTGLLAQKTSKDNYTGDWETTTSWNPTWAAPLTTGIAQNITIYGFITRNGDLSFGGAGGDLIVSDTLMIDGSLTLGNNNNITVNNGGILFVTGNVTIANKVDIAANAYIIVLGDFTKTGSAGQGSFTSDDEPSNVFIGGTIDVPAGWADSGPTDVFNCDLSVEHDSSQCNYGNSVDILEDSINDFIQTTCLTFPSFSQHPQNASICDGNNTSFSVVVSGATSYQWQVNIGSGFGNVFNGGVYSGATTTTLTITGATLTMNSYIYRCVARASTGCTANSNTATIIVADAPTITSNATATSICYSPSAQSSSLSYTATTGSPTTYSITWNAAALTAGLVDVGSTTLTASPLTIPVAADIAASTYTGTIVVSNAGCSSTGNSFTLTINSTPSAVALFGITESCAGATDVFAVTNDVTWTYTWTVEDNVGIITPPVNTSSASITWRTNAEILSTITNISKTVSVLVTEPVNSCTRTVSWSVTIYRVPETSPQYHIPNNYGL
jgi:hypothetical protein